MKRGLLIASIVLSACSSAIPQADCDGDSNCPDNAVCQNRICVYALCETYQTRVNHRCIRTIDSIVVQNPAYDDQPRALPVTFAARLQAASGATPSADSYPAQLSYTVSSTSVGAGGPWSGTLTRGQNENLYTGQWTPGISTTEEMIFLLTVSGSGESAPAPVNRTFRIDVNKPKFEIQVFNFVRSCGQSKETSDADPCDRDENGKPLLSYFKRDESALAMVSSSDQDIDWNSVTVAVKTNDGGSASFPLAPSAACPIDQICATIPLYDSNLIMNSFRAEFTASVNGYDLAGNLGDSNTETLNVTRFKWHYKNQFGRAIANSIRFATDPVIDSKGNVYFIDLNGVMAISPSGNIKNCSPSEEPDSSNAYTSLVIGKLNNQETVFVAGSTSYSAAYLPNATLRAKIWAITDLQTATEIWSDDQKVETKIEASIGYIADISTLVAAISAPKKQADSASKNYIRMLALDSSGNAAVQSVTTADDDVTTGAFSGVAITQGNTASSWNVYIGDSNGAVREYQLANNQWSSGRVYSLTGNLAVPAITDLAHPSVAIRTDTELFLLPLNAPWDESKVIGISVPASSYTPSSIAEISNNLFAVNSHLVKASLNANQQFEVSSWPLQYDQMISGPNINSTPLSGNDNTIYVVASINAASGSGDSVFAIDASGNTKWASPPSLFDDASYPHSTAIDCARDGNGAPVAGQPAVLYVKDAHGNLFASIVDSRGLDSTSFWPKARHDQQNTSDANHSLTTCP